MTGTSSRTATALGGGIKRAIPMGSKIAPSPRGSVGRKLEAKPWPKEHEPHRRRPTGGQGAVGIQSPMSSGPTGVYAAGMGRRSRVLPREICLSVSESSVETRSGRTAPNVPAHAWSTCQRGNELMCPTARTGTREAARGIDGQTEVSRGHTSHVQVAKGQTCKAELVRAIRGMMEAQSMGGGVHATRETGGRTADGPVSRVKHARHGAKHTKDEGL